MMQMKNFASYSFNDIIFLEMQKMHKDKCKNRINFTLLILNFNTFTVETNCFRNTVNTECDTIKNIKNKIYYNFVFTSLNMHETIKNVLFACYSFMIFYSVF